MSVADHIPCDDRSIGRLGGEHRPLRARRARHVLVVLLLGLLASAFPGAVSAQYPHGGATPGSSGFLPFLVSGQAWTGNPSFAFEIHRAPAGAPGLLAVSLNPAASGSPVPGVFIGLTPAELVLLQPFTVSGIAGAAVTGSASVMLPLSFPPSLAGTLLHAQAGILDGGLATTNALRLELTLPPLLVVATSSSGPGPTSVFALIDPEAPALVGVHGPEPWEARAICLGPGGRDLFVATPNALWHAPLTGLPLAFTQIFSSGSVDGVAIDRGRKILYTVATSAGAVPSFPRFVALDGDPASPTFGTVRANGAPLQPVSPFLPAYGRTWDLADAQDVAAVLQAGSLLQIVDMDPARPTYLQQVGLTIIPGANGGLTGNKRVIRVAPDGEIAFVLFEEPQGARGLFRYHIPSGSWIDHDSLATGCQPIGPTSAPAHHEVLLYDLSRDGFGAATVSAVPHDRFGLLTFVPGFPTAIGQAIFPLPFSPLFAHAIAISGDRRKLAFVQPTSVRMVDLASVAAFGPTLTFPGSGNVSDVVFR